jgi:predicted lactoylglutathione lyase
LKELAMATKLFVNLPVKDLNRSKAFFTELGLTFFGQAEGHGIGDHQRAHPGHAADRNGVRLLRPEGVADASAGTEVILVLGVETRDQVDQLADRAEAAGGSPVGTPQDDGWRYQRGFTDLDGHQWAVLCLIDPAS